LQIILFYLKATIYLANNCYLKSTTLTKTLQSPYDVLAS